MRNLWDLSALIKLPQLSRPGCDPSGKFVVDKRQARSYNIQARGINSVVECHLAKVKVASSSLVSRSKDLRSSAVEVFFCLLPFLRPLDVSQEVRHMANPQANFIHINNLKL